MDDDPAIRRSLRRLMTQMGYRLELVNDGMQAIEAYRKALQEGDPYAVVFLDLTVPGGMGGREAAKALRFLNPEVLLVIASGYSDNGALADPFGHGFNACVGKPCNSSEISEVLESLLSRPTPKQVLSNQQDE